MRVSFSAQTRSDGETCSWCKLVGVQDVERTKLTYCRPCWRARRICVNYCSRRCQADAWRAGHKVECASTAWSPAQHGRHDPVVRAYVARLTNDVMVRTLMWRREPSYAKRLYLNRVLPYLLTYDADVPRGWAPEPRLFRPELRTYVSRLTNEVASYLLMFRRERRVARVLWKERILPFLLDGGTRPPPSWRGAGPAATRPLPAAAPGAPGL